MTRKLSKAVAGALAAVMVMGLAAGAVMADEQEQVAVTFAHNSTEASPWEAGVQAAIATLSEETDGVYAGTSYPNGSLFQSNWEILLEMTQTNSIQIGVEAASAIASLNNKINFLCLPFMFEDNDQVFAFMNSGNEYWEAILADLENSGIKILGMCPRPMRNISNNKHAVNTMEDFDDLTLRSPTNNIISSAMEAIGIKAVPMASSEIYSAIQLGTVDGEDNSLAQQYDAKTLEVVDYFCLCNYIADGSVMFVSKEFYDAQTPEVQQALMDAGKAFAETTYANDNDYFQTAYDAAIEMGIEFTELPSEEKARCKEACASVYDEFKTQFEEDEWNSLMEAVEASK